MSKFKFKLPSELDGSNVVNGMESGVKYYYKDSDNNVVLDFYDLEPMIIDGKLACISLMGKK